MCKEFQYCTYKMHVDFVNKTYKVGGKSKI